MLNNPTKKFLKILCVISVFLSPIVVVILVNQFGHKEEAVQEGDIVRNSFSVTGPGECFRVLDGDILNPKQGKDFVINAWIRFRKLPKENEKIILFTKYDAKTVYKQGYAMAVEKKEKDIYRGSIFWQDINNNGRWYTFDEMKIDTGKWYMFTLNFTLDKYLAMYYTYEENGKIHTRLLGAQEVNAFPQSKSPFQIGAVITKTFNGRVGTVSVISTDKFLDDDENPQEVFKEIYKSPLSIPNRFSKDDILLWTLGGNIDLGNNNIKINKVILKGAPQENSKEKETK